MVTKMALSTSRSASPRRQIVHCIVFAILFALAVPWYWTRSEPDPTLWWGIPAWFIVAVAVSFVISLLASFAFSLPWPEELEELDKLDEERQMERRP